MEKGRKIMPKALYAGSFDPFTTGHLNVLLQASKVFEKVYLVISLSILLVFSEFTAITK